MHHSPCRAQAGLALSWTLASDIALSRWAWLLGSPAWLITAQRLCLSRCSRWWLWHPWSCNDLALVQAPPTSPMQQHCILTVAMQLWPCSTAGPSKPESRLCAAGGPAAAGQSRAEVSLAVAHHSAPSAASRGASSRLGARVALGLAVQPRSGSTQDRGAAPREPGPEQVQPSSCARPYCCSCRAQEQACEDSMPLTVCAQQSAQLRTAVCWPSHDAIDAQLHLHHSALGWRPLPSCCC